MKLQHECIEDALGALAKDRPAAPALQAPGRKPLTYADLAAQIHRVRKYLGGLDIGRGDIVAGVIPSRPEMAVACATLPASSTFAPLSPSLTPDDYSQLVVRMGAKAILAPKGEEHPVRAAARRHGVAEIDVAMEPDAPPASPPSPCPSGTETTGCRRLCSSSAARPARASCSRWPRSSRPRGRGRLAGRS